MSEFFYQIFGEQNDGYSLIIEDNGRVAYAYLCKGEDIIGDVWLYNQDKSPDEVNWDPEQMPFLNPGEFLKDNISITPIKENEEVNCVWELSSNNELKDVQLYLNKTLIAKLEPGSKPGWSKIVKKDGPLAKVFL